MTLPNHFSLHEIDNRKVIKPRKNDEIPKITARGEGTHALEFTETQVILHQSSGVQIELENVLADSRNDQNPFWLRNDERKTNLGSAGASGLGLVDQHFRCDDIFFDCIFHRRCDADDRFFV